MNRKLLSTLVLIAAGCGAGARDATETVRAALFTNGSFESDATGAVPSGWTVSTYQNNGITDTRPAPQTLASLNLQSGGYAATYVVGGTAESQTDPDLGATATFRYPKYGSRALRINLGTGAQTGAFRNVNGAAQTMTVSNADVDTSDNKVHIRGVVAPVLQNPNHAYDEQPYYFVQLRNITKGTTLYQDFNASAQTGVPWKIVSGVYYTDWQMFDIAPGNAALAVGDQVELQILAAGCSQLIHWGRIYVDGVGASIPGIYTYATAAQSVNAGANLTYTINYKNGGTTSTSTTKLEVVVPDNTTFQSVSLPAACTAPAVGATGTVVCTLGTLAPGASGSFTVTVAVGASASGTITNGNYYIYASGVSPLLGPKVQTSITSNVTYSDVSITKSDGIAALGWGQATTYTITASNAGPSAAASVSIADTMPAQLTGVTWTCAGAGGGTCPSASGSGSIAATGVALPVGGSVTYTVQATIVAGSGSGSVTNTATASVASPGVDPDTTNNSAVDTDSIGTLRTLTLTKTGAAGGTVASSPAAISCGTSCSGATGSFLNGTQVVLTASAVAGGTFTGWGGSCASAGTTPTCTVTMSANLSVTAAFVPPSTISVSSGSPQTTAVSTAFALPLKALVVDSSMNPLSGVTVVFAAPGSGASATLSATTATTNAQGIASVTATANATAGSYTVSAGISGTTAATSFSLTNYGAPASITVVSGSGQSATVGAAFGAPLVVVVRDAASQVVPNATVTFAAPASGARATLGATSATTNASGQASVSATAGTVAGSYSVTASVSGVATSASFALTNTAGAAASITASAGSGQSATVGTAFASALVATVTDASGNPVAGVTVTFAPPASGAGAALGATTGTSNAAGQVSTGATANTVSGAYAVTASAAGVATSASFALTNTAGAAAAITATSGGGQSAQVGTAFASPLVVTVRDSYGNLVSGTAVTFTPPASGASATLPAGTVATNSSGQASKTATANTTAGSYAVTASVGALTATFSLRNYAALALAPATVSVAPRGGAAFTASGGPGSSYTYSFATNSSGGAIDAVTGVYTAGGTPSVTDVVKVTDGVGGTATATITVGAGVSLSPASATVAPRGAQSFTASGGSGTGFSYTLTTNGSGGSVNATTGAYTAGATGGTTDVVNVIDSLGNSASATITVGAGVSVAPATATVAPRGSRSFTASGGSGTGFSYTLTTNGSGGSVNATTGAYTAGATGGTTDVVKVTDSLGNSASATITISAGVSISPASVSVAPLGARTFSASGGSGAGFTYALVTNGSGGSINATTGAYAAGSTGNTTDVVKVTDSLGNSATATVSVGGGLALSPSTASVAPRGAQSFSASGGSGAGFTFSLTTNGSGAAINPTTGAYTAGATGGTTDVVKVTDSLGNSASATITVTAGVTITPPAATVAPRAAQSFSVSGGSGAGFTFSLTTNGSGATINATTGAYTAGTTAATTDVVKVTDSLGNSASATITVGAGVSITPATSTVTPRGSQSFSASGGSGSGFSYTLTTNASGGSVNATTGAYTAGSTGGTTDVVKVTDAVGNSASATITIGAGVTITPATATVAPRGSKSFSASGGSGSGFSYALTTNGSGGSVDPTTGAYTAGATAGTTDVVKVTDALGNSASATVTVGAGVSITPVTATVAPRAAQSFSASGGSGSGFTYTLTANGSGATINATTGAYTAGATAGTTDVVKVTDALGNSASATISVGAGVTITPATATVVPRGTKSFSASGGSGSGFTYTLTTNGSGGSVDSTTGAYTAGATGGTTDVVKATDALGNSASATITVGAGVTITPATATVAPRGSQSFSASGGSGSGFTYTLATNASGGSVNATTGAYTAGPTPSTTDVVKVTDGLGNSATATVSVGGGVSVAPAGATVAPRGSLMLTATGGSGTGFAYALTSNGSGGGVDASGRYTAGPTGGTTDVVTVTDSVGNSATSTITVGAAITLAGGTATPPRGSLIFSASGGSGSGFAYSLATNASGGTIDAANGAYTAGPIAAVTDVVLVVDALGNSATANVAVGPGITLSPAAPAVAPRGALTLIATGGSGTGFAFTFTTNASGGTVSLGGSYVAGATPSSVDVVKVVDSLGNSASVSISVGGGLAITPASPTVSPRGARTFSASGGSGSGFTFALTSNGSGGVIDAVSGAYLAGPVGGTTDVVTVTDSLGNSAAATVHVGPGLQLSPPAVTLAPLGRQTFAVAGGSGAGYAFALATNASGGSITAATGAYTAGAVGGVADLVTATDSLGNSATVTVTVTAALAPLTGVVSVPPRGTATLAVTGGAGGVTFALTVNGSGGSVDPLTGSYVAGPTGNATDVVTVTDQNGASTTITIAVGAGISLAPAMPAVAPREALTITASGGAGSGYRFALSASPSGGTIDADTGAYQAGAVDSVVDVVTVTDGLGNSASLSISVGNGLVLTPSAPTPPPRGHVAFAAFGGSGSGYTFALTGNASGGSIDPATGAYTAGATPGVTDAVTVTDGLGNSATVSILVGAGVLVTPASASVSPQGALAFAASGGSGSGFVFALASNASGGSIDAATGRYVAGATGGATDVVTVTDGLGNSASATITVGAGVALSAPSATVPPRGSLALTASGGGGSYSFGIRSNGSGGSVVSSTGAYTAGPAPGTTDVVEVTDGLGNSATFTITVGPGVTITPESALVAPGGAATFTASGGSGSGWVFALTTNGSGASIDSSTGSVTCTYLAGPTGATTDVVTVTDGLGNSASAQIVIGDGVGLFPRTPAVPPRGAIDFTAVGGSGSGYVFSLAANASGANIDPITGHYVAGATPNVTDRVSVTDALGHTDTIDVAVGPGLTITPAATTLAPRGSVAFSVAGGSGSGYVFSLATNGSGGTVDAARGDYLAGATGDTTDLVRVTDSLGNSAAATVMVGPALRGPSDVHVPPRGSSTITVTGGAGPYHYALASNGSGGAVNATTGAYMAGPNGGGTDVVTVTDDNGSSTTVTIVVGPGVSIDPAAPHVAAGGNLTLTATGGSGSGYTWRIVDAAGGGSIDAQTGVYTAPRTPGAGKDVVEVTDALGNTARASVDVTVDVTPSDPRYLAGGAGCGCDTGGSNASGLFSLLLLAAALARSARLARKRVGDRSR